MYGNRGEYTVDSAASILFMEGRYPQIPKISIDFGAQTIYFA
jgi:hypothetical protein